MFGKNIQSARFVSISSEKIGNQTFNVMADVNTGVQYICAIWTGGGLAVTPLLDESGRPLINREVKREQ